jgi:hypothetical protein
MRFRDNVVKPARLLFTLIAVVFISSCENQEGKAVNCFGDNYLAFQDRSDYGISHIDSGPMPTNGASLHGDFNGFSGQRRIRNDSDRSQFTMTIVFHADTYEAILAKKRQLPYGSMQGCFVNAPPPGWDKAPVITPAP